MLEDNYELRRIPKAVVEEQMRPLVRSPPFRPLTTNAQRDESANSASVNMRLDSLELKIDKLDSKIETQIDRLDDKINTRLDKDITASAQGARKECLPSDINKQHLKASEASYIVLL